MTVPDAALRTFTLHAVRLLGFADDAAVARRFRQPLAEVGEELLDLEALGLVSRSSFAETSGWSLTERGREEGERRLAAYLDASGGRGTVERVHRDFLPLNARFQDAVSRWQIRPLPGAPMARNDHTDHRSDDRVLERLTSVGRRVQPLQRALSGVDPRFDGYAERYAAALERAEHGSPQWVDGVGLDSCHVVWMQLHEDLLATLGLTRGQEG